MKKLKKTAKTKTFIITHKTLTYLQLVAILIQHYKGEPINNFVLARSHIIKIPLDVPFYSRIKYHNRFITLFFGLFLGDKCIIHNNYFENE